MCLDQDSFSKESKNLLQVGHSLTPRHSNFIFKNNIKITRKEVGVGMINNIFLFLLSYVCSQRIFNFLPVPTVWISFFFFLLSFPSFSEILLNLFLYFRFHSFFLWFWFLKVCIWFLSFPSYCFFSFIVFFLLSLLFFFFLFCFFTFLSQFLSFVAFTFLTGCTYLFLSFSIILSFFFSFLLSLDISLYLHSFHFSDFFILFFFLPSLLSYFLYSFLFCLFICCMFVSFFGLLVVFFLSPENIFVPSFLFFDSKFKALLSFFFFSQLWRNFLPFFNFLSI